MRRMRDFDYSATKSSTVATNASAAPAPNATGAPKRLHNTPNTMLAVSAASRWRQVRDERFLRAFREAEIAAVDHEPRQEGRQRTAERKARIHDRVDDPSRRDDGAPPDAIGPAAADQ